MYPDQVAHHDNGSTRARKAVKNAGGNPIKIKPSKVGTLHTALGVPQDKPIPTSMLASKPSDSPALAKKKNFARNARKWG